MRRFGLREQSAEAHVLGLAWGPTKPQPLPHGQGGRLDLGDVIDVASIITAGKLVMHLVGDTGGVVNPQPQQDVADGMAASEPTPSLFFQLGDVVYYNGEEDDYHAQFYEPYLRLDWPIFAIPGNHDGLTLTPPLAPSLAAFMENFCAASPAPDPATQGIPRDTMTQPYCYWTLTSPFATVIGLYSNVPAGGFIDDTQAAWLTGELEAAPTDRPLLVTLHHPPYSADAMHGSCRKMGATIDASALAAKRWPDMVLSGHVHNYQRFERTMPDSGKVIPYIVAGAGGYWNLHKMAKDANGDLLPRPWVVPGFDGLSLAYYNDLAHGYLELTLSATAIAGRYFCPPGPSPGGAVVDVFSYPV